MGQDLPHDSKVLTQSKKPFKHELGGGEYWENEALRAKIDGFGTRYNDDEYYDRIWAKRRRDPAYFLPRTTACELLCTVDAPPLAGIGVYPCANASGDRFA